MPSYLFRYANEAGRFIGSTAMICESDEEAIAQAKAGMQGPFSALEIFEGERTVHSWRSEPKLQNA